MATGKRPEIDIAVIQSLQPPGHLTVGQRWRWKRNVVIRVAYAKGLSQRFLGDVFDLPKSRISEIIKEVDALLLSRN